MGSMHDGGLEYLVLEFGKSILFIDQERRIVLQMPCGGTHSLMS